MRQRSIPDAARGRLVGIVSAAVAAMMFAAPAWGQEVPDEPQAEPPAAEQPQEPREPAPDAGAKTAEDVTMTHAGEFVRAEGESFTMTVDGREHSHRVQDDVRITLNGRPAELSDLRPGDQIRVTTPKTELGVAAVISATRADDSAAANQSREDQPRDSRQPQDQAEQRAALGVLLGESRGGGVLIRDVAPGSPADQAGIRPGDYITSLNDQRLNSPQDLADSIREMEVGERATLGVWRNEREMNVEVTVGAARDLAFRQEDRPRREDRPQGAGGADRAWLGVMLRDPRDGRPPADDEQADQEGVAVAEVYPSGPAARAGVRSGDAIIRIGEHEVQNLDDLYAAMDQLEPGRQTTLVVMRGGEEQELEVTPSSRGDFFAERDEFFGFGGPPDFERAFERFSNVPEPAMMLEQHRHMAAQHERLEQLLNDVLEEVQQLRREVRQLQGAEEPEEVFPTNPPTTNNATPPVGAPPENP